MKFARKGYIDKYVTKTFRFNPHRMTTAYMNAVPMIKLPKSSIKLGEATVKATKLMMVMRGGHARLQRRRVPAGRGVDA